MGVHSKPSGAHVQHPTPAYHRSRQNITRGPDLAGQAIPSTGPLHKPKEISQAWTLVCPSEGRHLRAGGAALVATTPHPSPKVEGARDKKLLPSKGFCLATPQLFPRESGNSGGQEVPVGVRGPAAQGVACYGVGQAGSRRLGGDVEAVHYGARWGWSRALQPHAALGTCTL